MRVDKENKLQSKRPDLTFVRVMFKLREMVRGRYDDVATMLV